MRFPYSELVSGDADVLHWAHFLQDQGLVRAGDHAVAAPEALVAVDSSHPVHGNGVKLTSLFAGPATRTDVRIQLHPET